MRGHSTLNWIPESFDIGSTQLRREGEQEDPTGREPKPLPPREEDFFKENIWKFLNKTINCFPITILWNKSFQFLSVFESTYSSTHSFLVYEDESPSLRDCVSTLELKVGWSRSLFLKRLCFKMEIETNHKRSLCPGTH